MLYILDGNPEKYQEFAEDYYETEIAVSAIEGIYAHQPLSETLVKQINEDVSLKKLRKDIEEIGYIYSGQST